MQGIFIEALAKSRLSYSEATRTSPSRPVAAGAFQPHSVIYSFSGGLPTYGFGTAYDPTVGRVNRKAIDCARARPAQPPQSYDLNKVGGAPDPGSAATISGNWKPRPASRV